MSESLNPAAVDAALSSGVQANPADVVAVPAAELVALRERAANYETVEKATAGYVVGNELGNALASRTDLVPGAAAHIAKLVSGDLKASRTGDNWRVATPGGKTAAERVQEFLADPSNAMFLKANARGGAGAAAGSQRSEPTGQGGRPQYRSVGEEMIARELEKQQTTDWYAKFRH